MKPRIERRLRAVLRAADFLADFLMGFLAGLDFRENSPERDGKRNHDLRAVDFFARGFAAVLTTGFLAAGFATLRLFFGNFAAEYRRSATKRLRFLPVPLIIHLIWCLPVFFASLHMPRQNVEGVAPDRPTYYRLNFNHVVIFAYKLCTNARFPNLLTLSLLEIPSVDSVYLSGICRLSAKQGERP